MRFMTWLALSIRPYLRQQRGRELGLAAVNLAVLAERHQDGVNGHLNHARGAGTWRAPVNIVGRWHGEHRYTTKWMTWRMSDGHQDTT